MLGGARRRAARPGGVSGDTASGASGLGPRASVGTDAGGGARGARQDGARQDGARHGMTLRNKGAVGDRLGARVSAGEGEVSCRPRSARASTSAAHGPPGRGDNHVTEGARTARASTSAAHGHLHGQRRDAGCAAVTPRAKTARAPAAPDCRWR